MDEFDRAVLINFLAKTVDINLDQVGFAVEVAVPDMLHDFTSGNKFRRPKEKQFKQSEFPGSQRDGLLVARGAPAVAVECEVCVAKLCVAAMKPPTNQCPDSSQELRQNKWLGEIVRSEEHTSELQSRGHLVCRLL